MAMTHPDLATEYQGDANLIIARTVKKLVWKCGTCEHEWIATGEKRSRRGDGCTACANKVINNFDGRNSMAMTHPDLMAEYQGDATKIVAGTHKKLDWKCNTCDNEWQAQGKSRTRLGNGCPACAGVLHSDGRNSMAMTHPDLAKEYQGDATKLIAGTNKKLLWKCLVRDNSCGREWRAVGTSRAGLRNGGCPTCAKTGFKPSEPAWAYLLKYQFSDGVVRYKQGITNNDVKYRVAKLRSNVNKVFYGTKVTSIDKIYFDVGQDAKDLENHFLSLTDIRWTPDKKFDGFKEMYAEGILEAWDEKIIMNNSIRVKTDVLNGTGDDE